MGDRSLSFHFLVINEEVIWVVFVDFEIRGFRLGLTSEVITL